jgi:hypothetical protein
MTVNKEKAPILSNDDFLTLEEQAACAKIIKCKAPNSQRAAALLAISKGSTQAQAADEAGLSIGQVKYWVARFRKQRLQIFPDELLSESESLPDSKMSATKEKSKKKAGKGKETMKKGKKADKDKKGKKGKKNKKKKKGKKGKKNKKKKNKSK